MPNHPENRDDYLKNLDEKTYQFDLFIAFICDEENSSQEAARRIYEGLKDPYYGYDVIFQPITLADKKFTTTPKLAKNKAKAFLLVIDPKTKCYPGTKQIQLYRQPRDGESAGCDGLVPKEVAKEIHAAMENEFIRGADEAHSCNMRIFYNAPVGQGDPNFNCHDNFRAEDFLTPEERALPEEKRPDKANPFDGATVIRRNDAEAENGFPSDIVELGNWLKGVASSYRPAQTMDKHIYWVGTRLSDIDDCDNLFYGAICLFGENDQNKHLYSYCDKKRRIDHNLPNDAADAYIVDMVREIAASDEDARFYFYNPTLAYDALGKDGTSLASDPSLKERCLCLNDEKILHLLKDKKNFLDLCNKGLPEGKSIHTIPYKICKKEQCDYESLRQALCSEEMAGMSEAEKARFSPRFVVQAPIASGGESTFILDGSARNRIEVFRSLQPGLDYICTVFQERNVPVNVHAIIFPGPLPDSEPTILLSSPSIQLSKECDNRIIYRGADFIECRNIHAPLRDEFLRQAKVACLQLYKQGYRGICGIDGLILNAFHSKATPETAFNDVCLLEVNARFQASSGLINKALRHWNGEIERLDFPSLQILNLNAFEGSFSRLSFSVRQLCKPIIGANRAEVAQEWGLPSLPKDLLNQGCYFSNLPVIYSNFNYINNGRSKQAMLILDLLQTHGEDFKKHNFVESLNLDGLSPLAEDENPTFEPDAHLYRVNFTTNLSWVNPQSCLYFHQNIVDESEELYLRILGLTHEQNYRRRDRMIRVKVALLIQGARIAQDVAQERPGTFGSVDMIFKSREFAHFVVNAPVERPFNCDENSDDAVKFTGFTPFCIEKSPVDPDGLVLTYYGRKVDDIMLFGTDVLAKKKVGDIDYEQIAYLSTDRLRVHNTNACKFKLKNAGCRFCNIKIGPEEDRFDHKTFSPENIHKVVSDYVDTYIKPYKRIQVADGVEYPALRHFLIGGQSMDLSAEGAEERLVRSVKTIASSSEYSCDIYAMIIPCSPSTVIRMHNAGLTQLAFNIEMVDDVLAHEMMPGKRRIDPHDVPPSQREEVEKQGGCSFREYLDYLRVSRRIMHNHESVRSMLLIGLEPLENTIRGVKELLKIDVQPMLSIFRPMPGTPCQDYISPYIEDVVSVYEQAAKWCRRKQYSDAKGYYDPDKHMHLGPDCVPCQNNTVALPYEVEEEEDLLIRKEIQGE